MAGDCVRSDSNNTGGVINNAYIMSVTNFNNHSGAVMKNSSSLSNYGSLANAGTLTNQSGALLTNKNGASLNNSGGLANSASISNAGTFTQTGGTSQIDGSFTQSQINIQGGQMFGTGTITGPVLNTGGIIQGGAPGTVGTLSIDGSFAQGPDGTVRALISGTGAGETSLLDISGPLTLAGTLDITTTNGFTLAAGDIFELITFKPGSLIGSFDHLVYGIYSGTGMSLNIGNNLMLSVVYNNSGGSIQLNVAAVPEPSEAGLMLAGLGLIGFVVLRRKQGAVPLNPA